MKRFIITLMASLCFVSQFANCGDFLKLKPNNSLFLEDLEKIEPTDRDSELSGLSKISLDYFYKSHYDHHRLLFLSASYLHTKLIDMCNFQFNFDELVRTKSASEIVYYIKKLGIGKTIEVVDKKIDRLECSFIYDRSESIKKGRLFRTLGRAFVHGGL